jgi:fatty acyl-CoA reductase
VRIVNEISLLSCRPTEVPVFNVTCHPESKQPWGFILEVGRLMVRDYPFEFGLWIPGGGITTNKRFHQLNVALFHWLPAYVIDFLLFCFGQKRL